MMVRKLVITKNSKIVWLMLLLSLQSCALVTSYRKFSLERKLNLTLQEKTGFYDGNSHSLIFYEDGSCLLMSMPKEWLGNYLKQNKGRIYSRIPGFPFYHWGVYQIKQDTIRIELLEKVDQLGFMGITRWVSVLKDEGKELELLPGGPVNREKIFLPTLPKSGLFFKLDSTLNDFEFSPEKAWVNK